jgi:hypothetical protein
MGRILEVISFFSLEMPLNSTLAIEILGVMF